MRREHLVFGDAPLPYPGRWWRALVRGADTDGDTITLAVDRGFTDLSTWDVRLASIDTFERFSGTAEERQKGYEAFQFVRARLQPGMWCYVYSLMDPDRYGRFLGDPYYLGDDGALHDLALELFEAGFEKTGTRYPFRHDLRKLEEARFLWALLQRTTNR